jgi:hypothetical protein
MDLEERVGAGEGSGSQGCRLRAVRDTGEGVGKSKLVSSDDAAAADVDVDDDCARVGFIYFDACAGGGDLIAPIHSGPCVILNLRFAFTSSSPPLQPPPPRPEDGPKLTRFIADMPGRRRLLVVAAVLAVREWLPIVLLLEGVMCA